MAPLIICSNQRKLSIMKKNLLIETLAKEAEISTQQAERAISAILSGITEQLHQTGEADLPNFGQFKILPEKGPETQKATKSQLKPTQNKSKKSIRFTAADHLKAAINGQK